MVEVLIHYWNTKLSSNCLDSVLAVALSEQRTEVARPPRVRQHRLQAAEVMELVAAYEGGTSIKELTVRFDIHRHTVTALLAAKGVVLRSARKRPECQDPR
jgi:hypothetical protein